MKSQEIELIMTMDADVQDPEQAQRVMEEFREVCQEFFNTLEQKQLLQNMSFEYAVAVFDPAAEDAINAGPELTTVPYKVLCAMEKVYTKHRTAVDTDMYRRNPTMRGMYNGMELLMSILDEREAVFLNEHGEFYREVRKPL